MDPGVGSGLSRRSVMLGVAGCGALAAWLGRGMLDQPNAAGRRHSDLPIGMNLGGLADWSRNYPFLNLMWGARVWLTRNVTLPGAWDTAMAHGLETEADGYPLEVPFRPDGAADDQYVFTLLPSALEPGRYVLLYDGEGEIDTGGGARILNRAPGRIEISMAHGGRDRIEEIWIKRSQRGNHIRNMRVLAIEHEKADLQANPFRNDVLEFCAPWYCLRFMDLLSTNNSINMKWSDRKRRSFYSQVGVDGDLLGLFGTPSPQLQRKWSSGVALELCIQLANLTKTDAWFCVPHLADDEYIFEMAKLVRDTLDPDLTVYVEFSNELWNWQFLQAQWMLRSELAGDLVVAAGDPPPWRDGVKPPAFRNGVVVNNSGEGSNHPERIAALFRRCFSIWEDAFKGKARSRLVRVCAVQADWPSTAERTLTWVMRNGGCDALAPAGYFAPDRETYRRWETKGADLTADDVIADMKTAIARGKAVVDGYGALAKRAGVRFVTYEGGQHIQPEGQLPKPYNPALGAAQKHPAMYELYRQHLDHHARAGCDLFCAFSSVGEQGLRWGSWGHAERYGQDPAEMPKYKAILDANTIRQAR